MLLSIAFFEFRRRLKLVSTYIYAGIFLACSFIMIAALAGAFPQMRVTLGERVSANSPYALHVLISELGLFGFFIVAVFSGRAVQQDFEYNTSPFFFSAPITKGQYLGGRLLGAILTSSAVLMISIGLGTFLATVMPWVDRSRLGPQTAWFYVQPLLVNIFPNIIFGSALFFGLAAITRKMAPVYVAAIVFVVGYSVAAILIQNIDNKTLSALLDPFGKSALGRITEYWTISEKNSQVVPLEGVYFINRVLWIGFSLLLLAVCFARFSVTQQWKERLADRVVKEAAPVEAVQSTSMKPQFSPSWRLRVFLQQTWFGFRDTVRNVYFLVISLAGMIFLIGVSTQIQKIFNTPTYPVTFKMLDSIRQFSLFFLIIIAYSSGELVWREREHGLSQIYDALPVSTVSTVAAKFFSLILAGAVLFLVLMLVGMGLQVTQGYHRFEIPLYLKELFGLQLMSFVLTVALAICVHSIVNHKYMGHLIVIAFYFVKAFGPQFGFEHHLFYFGSVPDARYSDLNGYGHLLRAVLSYDALWASVALLMAIATRLAWVRGTDDTWSERWRLARKRFGSRVRLLTAGAAVAVAGMTAFVFYNTNVLNRYLSSSTTDAMMAKYEQKYKVLEDEAQPKIISVKLSADIYPRELKARIKGSYQLENKTDQDINRLYVNVHRHSKVNSLNIELPSDELSIDKELAVHTYKLRAPLKAHQTTALNFDLEISTVGFRDRDFNTSILGNGTFFMNTVLPHIGYQSFELTEDNKRKKYGLPIRERMLPEDDPVGLQKSALSNDADFIDFAATVSTDPDQTAIAPGYLQREWNENGRRYFEYKMDSPITGVFAIQSARYSIRHDHWNEVAIDVYYHQAHPYNVEKMVQGVKDALNYYTQSFGPYQHKQLRIVEFPRYETFAISLPNTVPFSEAIGFIAKVDPSSEEDVDYPYYVTAHEVAHQWWGHQAVPAKVRGAALISETLAQYSALMVMKRRFGPAQMGRFLRYELDKYLLGRGLEQKKELPLLKVETQPYIYYQKGSLAMYALQDYIGEDKVNQALRNYLNEVKFKGPPYPNSIQFLSHLEAVTPDDRKYVIDDLFRKITLFENRAISSSARPLTNGKYEVTIKAKARKLQADEIGTQKDVPLADWIDFGALDEKGNAIALEKRKVTTEDVEVQLIVDKLPTKAGIDPLHKLIDRNPKDNVTRVDRIETS